MSIPALNFTQSFHAPAGGSAVVNIPVGAELRTDDGAGSNGIHIVANAAISVYGLDLDSVDAITDSYDALPVSALGSSYRIMAFQTESFNESTEGLMSQCAIVATQDGTAVTIVPSADTTNHAANTPYTITLNAGQTYELEASEDGTDLTGTTMIATSPIACFGGCQLAFTPDDSWRYGNHLVEQLPSTDHWGTHFLTVPLATREGGDTFRILADRDNTHVAVTGQGIGLPVLAAGEFLTINVQGAQEITSDKPILVAQFANSVGFDHDLDYDFDDAPQGDPSMMLVPATSQYLSQYAIRTPTTGFGTNYVNVTLPSSSVNSGDVILDGIALDPGLFSVIGAPGYPSGYSGAQVPVSAAAAHIITSTSGVTAFGVTTYGFGNYDAYSSVGGLNLTHTVADPNGPAPSAPTNVTATAVSPTSVTLTWSDPGGDATGFVIEVGVMGANGQIVWTVVALVPNGTGSYTITGLNPDTTYYFQVLAYNPSNDSPPPTGSEPVFTHTPGIPPTAPTLASANGISQSEIDLSWTPGVGGEAGTTYTVQRVQGAANDASNWQTINSVNAPATTYQDMSGLLPDTGYSYRIIASNSWGNSDPSNVIEGYTLPFPPGAPLGFTATAASATSVNLTWQNSDTAATSFTIERSQSPDTSSDEEWMPVLSPGAGSVSATDTMCQPATTYYYRICANNKGGASAWAYANADTNGNPGPVTTLTPPAPGAPQSLTATGVSSSEIDLSWTDGSLNAPNGGEATGFRIEWHAGPSGSAPFTLLQMVAALPTTFSDTNLLPNTTYTYRVCAVNAGGASAYSNEATATTISGTTGGGPAPSGIYISSLAVNLPGILDNGTALITVTLNQAPTVPVAVTLGCTNSGVAALSSTTVTVAAGQTTATLLARGVPGGADALGTTVYLRGDCGGWTQGATLTVVPQATNFAPQNVVAMSGNGCIVLQWDGLPENSVKGFHVYRRVNQSFATEVTTSAITAGMYADTSLDPESSYSYGVGVEHWDGTIDSPTQWASTSPLLSGPTLTFDASTSFSWTGLTTISCDITNAPSETTTTLLVDGKVRGNGGTVQDAASSATSLTNLINSTSLTDGAHVVQVVASGGQTICATPPATVIVANGLAVGAIDPFFVTDSNELALITSHLPANTQSASVVITDESGAVVLQHNAIAPGSSLKFAWDGTNGAAGATFLPEQEYTITIAAANSAGSQMNQSVRTRAVFGPCKALVLVSNLELPVFPEPLPGYNAINDTLAGYAEAAFIPLVNGITRKFVEDYGGEPINVSHRLNIIHWLQLSVSDFYVHSHGQINADRTIEGRNYSENPGFMWGGINFLSSRGNTVGLPDAVTELSASKPVAIMNELLAGVGDRYEFVFVDTCYSSGGTFLPPNGDDTSNLSSVNGFYDRSWANDFGIHDNLEADSCYIGWNGVSYDDHGGYWTNWRKKFWSKMGEGALVSSAIDQAMQSVALYTPNYFSPSFVNTNINPAAPRNAVVGDTQLGSK